MLKNIVERDPLNSVYVSKYANCLAAKATGDAASRLTLIDEAEKVYERSLRQNTAQVDLWVSYLQFSMQHHSSPEINNPEGESTTRTLFERAINAVGQHMKAAQVWTMFIDFETSLLHLSYVHLLCYLAMKTPLLDYEDIFFK